MKTFYKRTILFIFIMSISLDIFAYDFEIDGIYYGYDITNMTAYVTYKTTDYNSYSGKIVIPSTVSYNGKTLNVASIGEKAFYLCENLKSVTIPKSVTLIDKHAFASCNLKSINLPENLETIARGAFSSCKSLRSIVIPNSVTTIGPFAFSVCKNLVSAEISNKITTIDLYTFNDCESLTSVIIPDSVKIIEENAFHGCKSLVSVNISSNATTINSYAFDDCEKLKSIYLPNKVTTVGTYVFAGCNNLKSIYFSKSVNSVGTSLNGAFYRTNNFDKVVFEDKIYIQHAFLWYSKSIDTLYLGGKIKPNTNNIVIPKVLILGKNLDTDFYSGNSGLENFLNQDSLRVIYSKIKKPKAVRKFDSHTYANVPLYIPKGTKSLYESADGWKQFFQIIEMDMTNLTQENIWAGNVATRIVEKQVKENKAKEIARYTIDGIKLSAPQKGVNIVIMSDGTTKKVFVK